MPRNTAVCVVAALLAALSSLVPCGTARGDTGPFDAADFPSTTPPDESSITSDLLTVGSLFIEGEYLQPPYRVHLAEDKVVVNDRTIDLPAPAVCDELETVSARDLALKAFHMLRGELRMGNVVCLFREQPFVALGSQGRRDFLNRVIGNETTEEAAARLASVLPFGLNRDVWNNFLNTVQVPHEFRERADALISEEDGRTAEAEAAYANTMRSHTFTYLLTIFGMVMAVYSTGHLLQWRPPRGTQPSQDAADDLRSVLQCLGLVVVLSALDLTWTYLASQQGRMFELNPLGSQMLSQPARMVAFKMIFTAGAVGLLFVLRHHRRAQAGAWWICLVCTMLTFRWLTFNSMFMS